MAFTLFERKTNILAHTTKCIKYYRPIKHLYFVPTNEICKLRLAQILEIQKWNYYTERLPSFELTTSENIYLKSVYKIWINLDNVFARKFTYEIYAKRMFIENCQETFINNLYQDNIENKHGANKKRSSNITAKWRNIFRCATLNWP